jgi:hypothetical protein
MRTILFVLALLGATAGRGQIFLDWYGAAAPAATLLLDDYPNAAAAYSLRLLRTAYTGNCIEVRKASDNTTSNLGFAGGVLDTAALKTFCASTDCFVRTWYDQAGGGWDQTQTSDVNQPLIVSGGVINRLNGQPAIFFNGTASRMRSAILPIYANTITTFCVNNFVTGTAGEFPYVYDQGSQRYIYRTVSGSLNVFAGATINGGTRVFGTQYLTYVLFNLTSSVFTVNTNAVTGSTGTTYPDATAISIGSDRNSQASTLLRGNIQEFITYRSNQSSNQSGIRGNINAFYSIY